MVSLLKAAAPVARSMSVRSSRMAVRNLSSSTAARKDFVQELYLRELKAYKAPQKAADSHVGQVREFATPSAPKAPAVPGSSELATQLSSYSSSEPDHAESTKTDASAETVTKSSKEDVHAFLADAAADFPHEEHH